MIEKFFNHPNVTVLENGFLKEGNNISDIEKIYLFEKTRSLKVQELGSGFIVDRIDIERRFSGYIYYKPSRKLTSDILKSLTMEAFKSAEPAENVLIANSKNGKYQYQIKGISITKGRGSIAKFSALSLEIIFLDKSNEKTIE